MYELIIFVIGSVKVACRSFQQKNVMHDKWLSIIPNSYMMAMLEVFTFGIVSLEIVESGLLGLFWIGIAYGTGGWMGCWLGMWLHNKLHP